MRHISCLNLALAPLPTMLHGCGAVLKVLPAFVMGLGDDPGNSYQANMNSSHLALRSGTPKGKTPTVGGADGEGSMSDTRFNVTERSDHVLKPRFMMDATVRPGKCGSSGLSIAKTNWSV
jgi:hypothetical protein